jgi:tripartite-type tricarboxylate transporter receptor subunit TctC
MTRRSFLASSLAGAAALIQWPRAIAQESADAYPSRPIRLMVGFAPGGSTDGPVRVLAEMVAKALRQPIVVENKPGVGGSVPVQTLIGAAPDGYTLAITTSAIYRMPYTHGIKWDPATDVTHIIGLTGYAFGIVVPAASPIKTFADYVAHARANPGKLSYGTPGVATTNHLTMERIARQFNLQLNHIPFKGSADTLNALTSGHVESAAETSAFVPLVQSGKLRLLVVWGSKRMARFPEVPTLREVGVNLVQNSPWGLAGPKGMDPKVVAKLHDTFKPAMESAAFRDALARFDMEPDYRSTRDFQQFAAEAVVREKESLEAAGLLAKP